MTKTSHGHHIAGTPTNDEKAMLIVNCGGPTVCGSCDFDIRWLKDYAEAKRKRESTHIFPKEAEGLNSELLRKVSAKIRERNRRPSMLMRIPEYQMAVSIHALADAMDSVARDLEP